METDSIQVDYFKKSRPRRLSSIIDARKVSFSVAENVDPIKQAEIIYNNILKLHPQRGCSTCVSINEFDSSVLTWNVSHLLRPCLKLASSEEQARTVALLGIPSSPVATFLQSLGMNSELAGFDQTSNIMRSVAPLTNLLQCALANLESTFPRVFAQAQVHLVGSATDYTLLTSLEPCLDYVVTVPAWIQEVGLCLCKINDVTAGGCLLTYPDYSRTPEAEDANISSTCFMSSSHQSFVCAIHELLLTALQVQMNMPNAQWRIEQYQLEAGQDPSGCYMMLGQIRSGRCKSLTMELEEKTNFSVKSKVKVQITFALPLILQANMKLTGFLLLAFSQFAVLDLGAEESKDILAGCTSENAPSLLCLRIAKFFAKLIQTFESVVAESFSSKEDHKKASSSSSSKLARSHSRVLRGLLRRQLEILDEFVEDGFTGSNLIKELCVLLMDNKLRLEMFSESRFPLTLLHCETWPVASSHLLAYLKNLFVDKSATAAKTLTTLVDKLCQLHAATRNEQKKTAAVTQQTVLEEICDLIEFQPNNGSYEIKNNPSSSIKNLLLLKLQPNSEVHSELHEYNTWSKRREINF